MPWLRVCSYGRFEAHVMLRFVCIARLHIHLHMYALVCRNSHNFIVFVLSFPYGLIFMSWSYFTPIRVLLLLAVREAHAFAFSLMHLVCRVGG